MAIDADLEVAIDTGKIFFEPPGLNEWAIVMEMDSKPIEEQATMLVEKILGVEGLVRKSGEVVTVESLKEKKFSSPFFYLLKRKWIDAVINSARGGAEEKNG
jgi:hypothetical protein